jgi:hypothetical protein
MQWVLDRPLRSVSETYEDPGNWHQIARVRTLCGKKIQKNWHHATNFPGYAGPQKDLRCEKCEAKNPTKEVKTQWPSEEGASAPNSVPSGA